MFVTHEVEEAITLGTRIIVMSQRPGQIIRDILIDPASKTKDYEETKEYKQLRREIHSLLE